MRIEFYNIFNHTNFANPTGDVASGNFGRIRGIRANTVSRQIQLGASSVLYAPGNGSPLVPELDPM